MVAGRIIEVIITSYDYIERATFFYGGSDDNFFHALAEIFVKSGFGAECS